MQSGQVERINGRTGRIMRHGKGRPYSFAREVIAAFVSACKSAGAISTCKPRCPALMTGPINAVASSGGPTTIEPYAPSALNRLFSAIERSVKAIQGEGGSTNVMHRRAA